MLSDAGGRRSRRRSELPEPADLPAGRAARRSSCASSSDAAVLRQARLRHIEFNRSLPRRGLALRGPAGFYADWLKVAAEAYHFAAVAPGGVRMRTGDFPAHNGREMPDRGDVLARAALVPHARLEPALDASPPIARGSKAGDDASAAILDVILRDEISMSRSATAGSGIVRRSRPRSGAHLPAARRAIPCAAAARPVQFDARRDAIRAGRTRRTGRTGRGGGRRATLAGSRSAALRRAAAVGGPGTWCFSAAQATRAARAAPRLPDAGRGRRRYNRTIILFLAAAMRCIEFCFRFRHGARRPAACPALGRPDAPTLFMLHGWMDVSASFQFVVDALAGDWQVIAPDARGFGLSDWPVARQGGGHYWFHEYLGDLDALVDHYAPAGEVNLVGHSMGANVVCLYAGARRSACGAWSISRVSGWRPRGPSRRRGTSKPSIRRLAHIAGDIPLPEFGALQRVPTGARSSSRMPATCASRPARADRGA